MRTKLGPRHFKAYPELARFASDEERTAAFKAFQRGFIRRRSFWLACLLFGLANAAVIAVSPRLLPRAVAGLLPHPLGIMILSSMVGACWGIGFLYIWNRPLRRHLRRWLADRGVPICIRCGYDLSGQIEPRCPECGEPCDPRLIIGQGPDHSPQAAPDSADPAA